MPVQIETPALLKKYNIKETFMSIFKTNKIKCPITIATN